MRLLDYAKISQDLYGNKKHYAETSYKKIRNAAELKGIVHVVDVDANIKRHNSFFAGLYVKFELGKAREAVIGIRGTVPTDISNDLEDVFSWFSSAVGTDWYDRLPTYMSKAVMFASKARDYINKHFPEARQTSYTGHSLGGAIAQLLALRGRQYKAVVFNSPGCKEIAGSALENRKNLITSINSRYGIINKIGHLVLGNLTVIDVPNLAEDAKSMITHFNASDFKKATEIAQFSDGLPTTSPITMGSEALSALYRIESVSGSVSALKHSPIDIIKAQHSINNLVTAMQNKQNVHIVDVAGETV